MSNSQLTLKLGDVFSYSPESLVIRAIRSAKPHGKFESKRWVAVMDTFAVGSTVATELCRKYNFDPHEMVRGVHCYNCDLED